MPKKAKTTAIEEWKIEEPKRNDSRKLAGIDQYIQTEDLDDYLHTLSLKRQELSFPACPAMPIASTSNQKNKAYAVISQFMGTSEGTN